MEEDEEWEVISNGSEVEWVEVNRTPSRTSSPAPYSAGYVATLEKQLQEAQNRATTAETHVQTLQNQLLTSRQEVRSLQVVVHQQRIENNALLAAALSAVEPTPRTRHHPIRAKRDTRSKACRTTAPQNQSLPKRQAWGMSNHRSTTSGARHT